MRLKLCDVYREWLQFASTQNHGLEDRHLDAKFHSNKKIIETLKFELYSSDYYIKYDYIYFPIRTYIMMSSCDKGYGNKEPRARHVCD